MARNRRRGEAEALIQLIGEDKVTELIQAAQKGVMGIADATEDASVQTVKLQNEWKLSLTALDSAFNLAQRFGQAVTASFDVIKEVASSQAVDRAFTQRFEGAEATVNRLREAVRGALSDRELKAFATQLNRANVSIEDTTRLLDVAARISAETGQALSDVTEELADAVIGASDSNLEKFGIIADLPELAKAYAKEQGIAQDKIDKSVESAAILRTILTDVSKQFEGADLNNLQSQVGTLEASFKNLSDSAKTFFATIAVGAAQDLGILAQQTNTAEGEIKALVTEMAAAGVTIEQVRDVADALNKQWSIQQQQLVAANPKVTEFANRFNKLLPEVQGNESAMRQLNEQIRTMATSRLGPLSIAIRSARDASALLNEEMQILHKEFGTGVTLISAETKALAANTDARYQAAVAAAELEDDEKRAAAIKMEQAEAAAEYAAAVRDAAAAEAAAARAAAARGRNRGDGRGPGGWRAGPETIGSLLQKGIGRLGKGLQGQGPDEIIGVPNELIEKIKAAREQVDALSASFEAFGEVSANALIAGLQNAGSVIDTEVSRISALFEAAKTAGLSTADATVKAVPGAVKAGADIAKGLGASIEVTETLYGLADVAQSATRFAMQDYLGGSMFAASAGLHFAAAGAAASAKGGGSPSGGGRGAAVPRTPTSAVGTGGGTGGGSTMQITQVFSGVMIGPGGVREASREVRRITEDEATRGARSADFVPAG